MRNECIACFQRGLGVTHEMEKNCIAGLRKCNFEVIIAPYEADPQLAYLCHIGHCDGVMTEDSDILVYSAVCGKPFPILYKFDKSGVVQTTDLKLCGIFGSNFSGGDNNRDIKNISSASAKKLPKDDTGSELDTITSDIEQSADININTNLSRTNSTASNMSNITSSSSSSNVTGSAGFVQQLFTHFQTHSTSNTDGNSSGSSSGISSDDYTGRRMFIQLCLLAGCDYSDSIHGVGIQKALQVEEQITKCALYIYFVLCLQCLLT